MVENKEMLTKTDVRKRKAKWESNGGDTPHQITNGVNFVKVNT